MRWVAPALWPTLAAAASVVGSGTISTAEFYGLTSPNSEGAEFKFEELKGARAILITNVASE